MKKRLLAVAHLAVSSALLVTGCVSDNSESFTPYSRPYVTGTPSKSSEPVRDPYFSAEEFIVSTEVFREDNPYQSINDSFDPRRQEHTASNDILTCIDENLSFFPDLGTLVSGAEDTHSKVKQQTSVKKEYKGLEADVDIDPFSDEIVTITLQKEVFFGFRCIATASFEYNGVLFYKNY